MSDVAPEESPPAESPAFPPPPQWLQTVIVLTALGWGTVEMAFLGGRAGSFAFIFSVLALSLGVRALGTIRGVLR